MRENTDQKNLRIWTHFTQWISLSTTFLSLIKLAVSLSLCILSSSTFKLTRFNLAAKLDVSTPLAPFKSAY